MFLAGSGPSVSLDFGRWVVLHGWTFSVNDKFVAKAQLCWATVKTRSSHIIAGFYMPIISRNTVFRDYAINAIKYGLKASDTG